ncbi:hypothetical protein KO500_16145 [Cellulophaga baltica]|uniref:hypothetical protein n=1 Tax=Cellulophaga TaxID=104264 RepID=UPI001C07496B|nr:MULTISPECIES: hypothetical protein [Cellulophaga]MBU2997974.1 hypothetical protein [Cellulophaga baltica]MDO6769375.1 hypothetical protein [Cellulophaga sp. 1_MG-2023]
MTTKKRSLLLFFSFFFAFALRLLAQNSEPLILDMVHHNPGEAPYKTKYNDPAVIKEMGYNGKVYFLFESPALAINWESVDKDILPKGTEDRKWVDEKAAQIKKMHAACKAEDMAIYAMSDLVLFPKRLIEKYKIEDTFGNPNDELTKKLVRAQINEMFEQFPDLDGLVVRIGETYLHDAPYHKGAIDDKTNPEKTIIPLINILKEEICEKRDKQLIFRTWGAFDTNMDDYLAVSEGVEPHKNLIISIKHCEGDFHRANNFSKVIGKGRHKQIIEVQSAREYEGKGAYPNYIANGVINGFEEHARMPEEQINSIQEFVDTKPELYAGVWTWSRGGGWEGPYIKDELWCDLNSWVMAQWGQNTDKSEEFIFNRYATERLHLKDDDVTKFRKLCLLSAEAVVRGRNSTYRDMNPWWTRDQGIAWPMVVKGELEQKRNLVQKDESIAKWKQIVKLAKSIDWDSEETKNHAIGSAEYGLKLYKIYRTLVYMKYADDNGNTKDVKKWIKAYDKAWADYNKLAEKYSTIATLYTQDYKRHIANNADIKVNKLR